jgi:hypothetical protein
MITKLINLFILVSLTFSSSCSKEKVIAVYDSQGIEIRDCGIRAADGRGPYELIGKYHLKRCQKEVAKLCNKKKFKQVHKTKGHFARGKFGEKIVIGTCP